jgi:hypothetical protein
MQHIPSALLNLEHTIPASAEEIPLLRLWKERRSIPRWNAGYRTLKSGKTTFRLSFVQRQKPLVALRAAALNQYEQYDDTNNAGQYSNNGDSVHCDPPFL